MMGWRTAPMIFLVAAVAGCGGSHSSSSSDNDTSATARAASSTSTPPSKEATSSGPLARYRADVNDLCAARNKQLYSAGKKTNQRAAIAAIAAVQGATIAQIGAIKPPSSMSSHVSLWLHSAEQAEAAILTWSKNLSNTTARAAYGANADKALAQAKALALNSCAAVGAI